MAKRGQPAASKRTIGENFSDQYARVLIPDPDGGYTAEILEFPGCFAEGDTPAEAIARVNEAAKSWIAAAREAGQQIPEPHDARGFSGNVALRMPKGLHKRAARMAERDRTSMNQWLVSAIAERVGAKELHSRLVEDIRRQARLIGSMLLLKSISASGPSQHEWQQSNVSAWGSVLGIAGPSELKQLQSNQLPARRSDAFASTNSLIDFGGQHGGR